MTTVFRAFIVSLIFLYHSSSYAQLIPFQQSDGKYGYVNSEHCWVIQPRFSYAEAFKENTAIVSINGKKGLIDKSGNQITSKLYDKIFDFSEGLARFKSGGSWGYIDQTGKIVIENIFKWAGDFNGGLAPIINIDQKYGYIDRSGNIVIQPILDDVGVKVKAELLALSDIEPMEDVADDAELYFVYGIQRRENFREVKKDNKWGVIDKKGEFIIKPQFDYAEILNDDLIRIKINSVYGLIDFNGKVVLNPVYYSISVLNSMRFVVSNNNYQKKYFIVDSSVKRINDMEFDDFEYGPKLSKIKVDKYWGFLDGDGNIAIQPKYSGIKTYCSFEDDLAPVSIDNKWGFINSAGKTIVDFKYNISDKSCNFSNGLIPMGINGKWGYIDKSEKIMISPQFDEATSFNKNGIAAVRIGDIFRNINLKGEVLLDPKCSKIH